MKKLLFFTLLILQTTFTFADDSGYGCMVGEHWVYTQQTGTASVTGEGPQQYKYFNYSGYKIPIYTGWGHNLYRGYRCGWINRYNATQEWDATIPPYGGMVQIPGEQEYTLQGAGCIVSTSVGGPAMATDGQSGVGQYVYYSYNKTNKCNGGNPENVPLDDHIWLLLLGTVGVGYWILMKKERWSV